MSSTYILSEAGLRTTSLGMLASGVRDVFGGVLMNGGGNPGGKLPGRELKGAGAGFGVDPPANKPAALS